MTPNRDPAATEEHLVALAGALTDADGVIVEAFRRRRRVTEPVYTPVAELAWQLLTELCKATYDAQTTQARLRELQTAALAALAALAEGNGAADPFVHLRHALHGCEPAPGISASTILADPGPVQPAQELAAA